jgi:hypothetical protein
VHKSLHLNRSQANIRFKSNPSLNGINAPWRIAQPTRVWRLRYRSRTRGTKGCGFGHGHGKSNLGLGGFLYEGHLWHHPEGGQSTTFTITSYFFYVLAPDCKHDSIRYLPSLLRKIQRIAVVGTTILFFLVATL